MQYIFVIIGFIVGLISWAQILYPLFHSLPKIRRYKKMGLFKKNPPLWYTLTTPAIWVSILFLLNYLLGFYKYIDEYNIGLLASFVLIGVQIFLRNPDLEKDFIDSYKRYLK